MQQIEDRLKRRPQQRLGYGIPKRVFELSFSRAALCNGTQRVVEATQTNNLDNFSAWFGKILDGPSIDCTDCNDEIFERIATDEAFRAVAQGHLAREVHDRVRGARDPEPPNSAQPSLPPGT